MVKVSIASVLCNVKSSTNTQIVCITGTSNATRMQVDVQVELQNRGLAIPYNATVDYVDVWSSRFTWGGGPLPTEGLIYFIFCQYTNLMIHK